MTQDSASCQSETSVSGLMCLPTMHRVLRWRMERLCGDAIRLRRGKGQKSSEPYPCAVHWNASVHSQFLHHQRCLHVNLARKACKCLFLDSNNRDCGIDLPAPGLLPPCQHVLYFNAEIPTLMPNSPSSCFMKSSHRPTHLQRPSVLLNTKPAFSVLPADSTTSRPALGPSNADTPLSTSHTNTASLSPRLPVRACTSKPQL